MPKSWINQSLDSAEGRDASAAEDAQYLAPRFTVPQDDEDIFHGGAAQGAAGPMPCAFSRMDAKDQGMNLDAGPFCGFSCRVTEIEMGPASPCYPCYPCRVSEDVDMTLHGDSVYMPCMVPCRMSEDSDTARFPLGCGFSRIGAQIETAADMDMTLLGESIPPPCIMPCRMSALETEQLAIPPCAFSRISGEVQVGAVQDNRIPADRGHFSHMPMNAEDQDISLDTSPYIPLGCRATDAGPEAYPPCGLPCRMSEEINVMPFPPCAFSRHGTESGATADKEMTALADTIPYPCLPPRMPESMQASSAAQLPPPAYYCRQSR